MKPQIAIIGTTASGKTDLAIAIARECGGEILSVDSLCVYKEISIASAKPSIAEMAAVRHFGVDLVSVDEEFNAGDFAREYQNAILGSAKPLIITGGSGFYLKSLLSGLSPAIPAAQNYPPNGEIFQLCLRYDPPFAQKFGQNDTFRLKKWFDIFLFIDAQKCRLTPSQWQREHTAPPIIKKLIIFDLVWDKEALKSRIKTRTQNMLNSGLLDEANALFNAFSSHLKPLNSIGLKECGEYLGFLPQRPTHPPIKNVGDLAERISTHTAQLAKRQRTFNASAFADKISLDATTPPSILAQKIAKYLTQH